MRSEGVWAGRAEVKVRGCQQASEGRDMVMVFAEGSRH